MDLQLKIPPVIVMLIIATAMWWVGRYLNYIELSFVTPLIVPLVFAGIGGLLAVLGVIEFYRKSTSTDPKNPAKANRLVTDGVYSISRNPMYLGMLLLLVAYGFYLGNGLTFLALPLYVSYMNSYQIGPEEVVMQEKFGMDYQKYKSEVRRWL